MKTNEALEKLDAFQRQIIHGPTTFKDIADVIRKSEEVRLAALKAVGLWLNENGEDEDIFSDQIVLCHRILATGEPDGISKELTRIASDQG